MNPVLPNVQAQSPANRPVRNILFIMCDQLRRDYLGCYGHPHIRTPHIDALAARGVRFTRCCAQGPVCGPSRMSTYTGRYVASHGCTWNFVPVGVHMPTMGDFMRHAGLRTAVVGKTHAAGDTEGMARLRLDPKSELGILLAEGGFEPFARHDGVVLDASLQRKGYPYNDYLRANGYPASNAWHDFANSALGPDGEVLSGWHLRHSPLPARVAEPHSETAWATDRAMDFIREQGDAPWCLHLSYIKPHWPYMAPAPYHAKYGADDVVAAVRSKAECDDTHPVYRAFRNHMESRSFSRDEVRCGVVPTYMGLITQIDDHIGRLMAFLETQGRLDDTLIVFTSDHGDLLGDHWLGEKEMFYEPSVGVPLIVVAPRGTRRGEVDDSLTEQIDLLPTFLEALGADGDNQWLEGQSLWRRLQSSLPTPSAECAVSELDYAFYPAGDALARGINDARATMVCTQRWKYVDYLGFRPQLFDLQEDPDELRDLGLDPGHDAVRLEMQDRLRAWRTALRNRTAMSDAGVRTWKQGRTQSDGVRIGEW